jgi:RND superfamily putative drug exporter
MLVVFGAFYVRGVSADMRLLGFALAVAVFCSMRRCMRLAVESALLVLAGRWNWWPGEMDGIGSWQAHR